MSASKYLQKVNCVHITGTVNQEKHFRTRTTYCYTGSIYMLPWHQDNFAVGSKTLKYTRQRQSRHAKKD
jgi:hypothetical protein